jgi:competence protein ComEC
VLHKEIPFLRICLPLCAGIVSGLCFVPGRLFIIAAAAIIITGFCASLFFNSLQTNSIFGFSLTATFFVAGLLLYSCQKTSLSALDPHPSIFACTVSDFPVEKTNTRMIVAKLNFEIDSSTVSPLKGSVMLYCKKDSSGISFLPGDRLIVKCTPVGITNRGNPYEFDYRFYMENHGIRYFAFTSGRDFLSHVVPKQRKLAHKALIMREEIIRMYRERGITGERLALVAAITLGQKNMLDPEQKNSFIKAGVMHIMAVSGLHTVILSMFVFTLLFFLKRRFNILRIILTLLILWSFAFVTGLTASVLRATLMFSFLQAGGLMKRRVNGINSVLASAFVLIIIRPSVIFEAGFLLSYLAVIYIIAFYRDLYQKLLFRKYLADRIWQSAVVSIVAQTGTLPLTIMLFNRFPVYFLITNIIIVPLSSLLVITGFLVLLLFHIRFVSMFLGAVLDKLAGLTELLTKTVSDLPFASIENIGMTTVGCLLLSVTVFLFTYYILKRRSFPAIYPLAALLIFLAAGTARELWVRSTNELIVYNTPASPAIGIRTGKILNLFSDTTAASTEVKRHCAALGLRLNMSFSGKKRYCIKAGETNLYVTGSPDNYTPGLFSSGFVILTGRGDGKKRYRSSVIPGEFFLIDASGNTGTRYIRNSEPGASVKMHSVRKSGAFIQRI